MSVHHKAGGLLVKSVGHTCAWRICTWPASESDEFVHSSLWWCFFWCLRKWFFWTVEEVLVLVVVCAWLVCTKKKMAHENPGDRFFGFWYLKVAATRTRDHLHHEEGPHFHHDSVCRKPQSVSCVVCRRWCNEVQFHQKVLCLQRRGHVTRHFENYQRVQDIIW